MKNEIGNRSPKNIFGGRWAESTGLKFALITVSAGYYFYDSVLILKYTVVSEWKSTFHLISMKGFSGFQKNDMSDDTQDPAKFFQRKLVKKELDVSAFSEALHRLVKTNQLRTSNS